MVRSLIPLVAALILLAGIVPAAAQVPRRLVGHADAVTVVAWSGDGGTLVSGDAHSRLLLWDTANWGVRTRMQGSRPGFSAAALNSDGTHLALGGPDGGLRIFGTADGGRMALGEAQRGTIHALAYEPGGTSLAATSGVFASPGAVTIRNAGNLGVIRALGAFPFPGYAIAYSHEGTLIAVGGGRLLKPGYLRVYVAATGALQAECGPWHDVVSAVAFAPGGNEVAGAGRDGKIRIYNTGNGEPIASLPAGPHGEVVALAYSRDGQRLAAVFAHGRIKVWDVATQSLVAVVCSPKIATRAAAFTRDGDRVAIGASDGNVFVYDVPSLVGFRMVKENSLRPCDEPICGAPNFLVIVADDLGYGDLGSYGQPWIKTPNLDRLAAEGTRLTNFYAGSSVGKPSRGSLMTGLHTGHARIRDNDKDLPLAPADVTIAEVLAAAGYRTGAIGRWELGGEGSTGLPTRQGFDHYFGSLGRPHSDNYYPAFLWRQEARVAIPENEDAARRIWKPDLLTAETLAFLEQHRDHPFFLYVSYPQPHAVLEVPNLAPYENEDWPLPQKRYAAAITRLDRHVGRILDKLDELGLAGHTMVVFTSDNGPRSDDGVDPGYFESAGPLRGGKGELYEGGVRVPGIIRWPARIRPRGVLHQPAAQWDLLPTFADLAGAPQRPRMVDGASLVPLFFGARRVDAGDDRAFYWERHVGGFRQAVRFGDWKAHRVGLDGAIELYDLDADVGESVNVAERLPEVVAEAREWLDASRVPSPDWPVAGER